LARPDFRATAARRLSEGERDLAPGILSLLSAEGQPKAASIKNIPVDRIDANPDQPRLVMDQESLTELAASVREHGVLQPILVRPLPGNRFQLVAGERRWRASMEAGRETIPAMIEELDDETALEIAIIENLQREDLAPLDEAIMYDRMIRDHGYSIRRLAQKLGKDKGYLENRLRLADAPDEIRELVSVRKDTLSHAYELLKIEDPKKRRRLAGQVARGELSLVKLREKVTGKAPAEEGSSIEAAPSRGQRTRVEDPIVDEAEAAWTGHRPLPMTDDSLLAAKTQLSEALQELVSVLHAPDVIRSIGDTDRSNLAKYLTIAKLKLENAIAMVRSGSPGE
jgi:ParB family transcriptional regulator, chromosome partitioning protein